MNKMIPYPAFEIVKRPPTTEEFTALIGAVGWTEYTNLQVIGEAIENSLFSVVAIHKNCTVGMGRIVGDGVRFFYVQDLAVMPEFQGKGIGTAIMDELIAYLNTHAPAKSYIHLFATKGKAPFYERYGFRGSDASHHYGMSVKKPAEPIQQTNG